MKKPLIAGLAATTALSLSLIFSGRVNDTAGPEAPDLTKLDAACQTITPDCAPALAAATVTYATAFQGQFKQGGDIARQQPGFAEFARETIQTMCLSDTHMPVYNPADQQRSDTLASNFASKCIGAIADIKDMAAEFSSTELSAPIAYDTNSSTRINAAAVQLAVPKRS